MTLFVARLKNTLPGTLTTTIIGKFLHDKSSNNKPFVILENPIKMCEFNKLIETDKYLKDEKGNFIPDEKGNPQKEKISIIEAQVINDNFLQTTSIHINYNCIEFFYFTEKTEIVNLYNNITKNNQQKTNKTDKTEKSKKIKNK